MSQAYKCDRCGKLYEAKERTLTSKKYSVLKPHTINYNVGNPGTYLSYVADLCPECQSELELWMSNNGKDPTFEAHKGPNTCSNCKYEGHGFNTEPCFTCSHAFVKWEPKEDQNE